MARPVYDHHHAVQFYGNDEHLYKSVAKFLGQGFVDGHPAILIGTADYTTAILDHLRGRMIDVDKARKTGDLLLLDAHKTLALFMDGDLPDANRFEHTMGAVIADLLKNRAERTMLRAYGEMVDVLWKDGRPEAAIRLEVLWNKIANQHGLALLCGYSMGNFFTETKLFEEVCRQHTHIMPAEVSIAPPRQIN